MIKLSVIIPIYNASSYLEKCFNNLLVSSSDVEYILVNDGSCDNSLEICQKYEEKYEQITLVNNENHGVSYSRNIGIDLAKGKYIMFVDADDVLSSDWYQCVNKYLNLDYELVIFNQNISVTSKEEMYSQFVGFNSNTFLAGPWSKLYRRDILQKKNIYFNETLINGEDLIFNILYFNNVSDYVVDHNGFYYYRVSNISSTKKFHENIFESDKLFHQKLNEFLPTNLLNRNELLDFSVQNACFTFMKRISYLNRYNYVRKYLYIFQEEPYCNLRRMKNKIEDWKIKFVLFFIKKRLYYLCYLIFKLNRKKKEKKEDYFIKI